MRKDLIYGMSVQESLNAGTTAGNGLSVDTLRKFAAKHVITCDAFTSDVTIKLQDSPDDSVFTDVPASKMIGASATVVFTAVNQTKQIAGADLARYQRVVLVSGTGTLSGIAETADNLGS
ncbi:MAG TPA: hypothetical protein EYN67_15895 [Flavobacteriales bacterium]|nr:hypothetical protein [Flavobacteriales bacterium]